MPGNIGGSKDRSAPRTSYDTSAITGSKIALYRKVSLFLFLTPFVVLFVAGAVALNSGLIAMGVIGLVTYSISTQFLVDSLAANARSGTMDFSQGKFRYISKTAVMIFFGIAGTFAMIMVIPGSIILSTPHPASNKIVWIVAVLLTALLTYRTYYRGLLEMRADSMRIHYILRTKKVKLGEVSRVEIVVVKLPVSSLKVKIRLQSGKHLSVPGLRRHSSAFSSTDAGDAASCELDLLSRFFHQQC